LTFAGKPFPVECRLILEEGQEPYPEGNYLLSEESFYPGDFGKVECSPKLVRVTK
jgi:hypothetical protein